MPKLSKRARLAFSAWNLKPDNPSDVETLTQIHVLRVKGCGRATLNEIEAWVGHSLQHGETLAIGWPTHHAPSAMPRHIAQTQNTRGSEITWIPNANGSWKM